MLERTNRTVHHLIKKKNYYALTRIRTKFNLNLPDGHWIFEGRRRLNTDNHPIRSQIRLLDFCRNVSSCQQGSQPKGKLCPWARKPKGKLCYMSPVRSVEYPIYPGKIHHFCCQKIYYIQRHCGKFSLGFIPLRNKFWHKKNGIATVATSCRKSFRSLYGKDVFGCFWQ